ncbi:hypothetical protein NIIDMKKI_37880 [Mycobacterium kansasii]|uniref:Uncharacterized protein n=1 Tax=Mycobacterium kansasii TaxID=1768 RepID=A0A7G1IF86_MYCKA|nr:hypothetical protein NIIDMKKI_37880 [Mycobacterium kansasii]
MDIHRKPGYDPAELLMNPDDRTVKAKAAAALAKKRSVFDTPWESSLFTAGMSAARTAGCRTPTRTRP